MSSSKPTRTYSNGFFTIEWRPEKCVHCQTCINELPQVFDLSRRPWVDLNGADEQTIRETVAKCPDGALSITEGPPKEYDC